MILGTYHAHTEFCDGKNTAEQMILAAIEGGASEIGLTPHSPIEGEGWCMSLQGLKSYKEKLALLKEKYRDKIRVFMGIEEDIISGTDTSDFDYVIGSVHSVFAGGKKLWVDLSASEVRENVNKYFHSDPYLYAEAYFDSLSEIYERTRCDVIGHFDLLTKFNEKAPLLDTECERYKRARDRALDKLLRTPAVFEINTGAIARGYRTTPYPDDETIKKIAESGKPFLINSDSHSKDTVLFGIREEQQRLDALGYKYISSMSELLHYTRGV